MNLYIHGLGYNRKWFREHFRRFELFQCSWIVPDLMGHGNSSKPKEVMAYSMQNQAEYLLSILQEESVSKVRIIAHSMGGAIAVSLIELLNWLDSPQMDPVLVLYLEGNLDSGDAFFSSKVARMPLEKYQENFEPWCKGVLETTQQDSMRSWVRGLYEAGSFTVWASSKDLVTVSNQNTLLERLTHNFQGPIYFIYGEKNKGTYSSEELVKQNDLPLLYVPKAGHAMHEENPSAFWKLVLHLIE